MHTVQLHMMGNLGLSVPLATWKYHFFTSLNLILYTAAVFYLNPGWVIPASESYEDLWVRNRSRTVLSLSPKVPACSPLFQPVSASLPLWTPFPIILHTPAHVPRLLSPHLPVITTSLGLYIYPPLFSCHCLVLIVLALCVNCYYSVII